MDSERNEGQELVIRESTAGGNSASDGISEAMQQAVLSVKEPITRTGKIFAVPQKNIKRMTAKMRLFSSLIAKGEEPRKAYLTAYDIKDKSDVAISRAVSRLMNDSRIAAVAEEAWESVKGQIVQDQVATRRHVMNELLKHTLDAKHEATKLKALELMGKAVGMFTDRVETKTEHVSTADLKKELESTIALMDEKPTLRSIK